MGLARNAEAAKARKAAKNGADKRDGKMGTRAILVSQ